MIDEPPWPFLMSPSQHRAWAANLRKLNRPDLAKNHEQLARAIEIRQRQQQAEAVESPPIVPASP